MANRQPSRLIPIIVLLALTLSGCNEAQSPAEPELPERVIVPTLEIDIWYDGRSQQAIDTVLALQQATKEFLDNQNPETRVRWQQSWQLAHDAYLTVALLTPSGELDRRIDPWPAEPGFIDSLPDYPSSGIINDDTLTIDAQTLVEQHQITDPSEVALGFHMIEYYAFARPLEDFAITAYNAQRRQRLIDIAIDQLVSDVFEAIEMVREEVAELNYPGLISIVSGESLRLSHEFSTSEAHSPFGHAPHHAIQLQLQIIATLLGEETGLSHYLIDLDPDRAISLNKTLSEIIYLLANLDVDDARQKKIGLLLSGLRHQLSDLAQLTAAEL